MSVAEIQISAAALKHNAKSLGSLLAHRVQKVAVVKANAYGHGLAEVVPILEPLVDAFQIDDLDELRALRQVSEMRALIFGYVPPEDVEEALKLGAELSVYDLDRVPAISKAATKVRKKAKVHLKIDALLGRLGALPRELNALIDELRKHPKIQVVAAYAHYANIEDTNDPRHVLEQESVFDECYKSVLEAFPDAKRHFSATSGAMVREGPAAKNALVRLGIGVYGLYPSEDLSVRYASLKLQPAMRWVTKLAQVKRLPAGHPVGYGLTYRTKTDTLIGIVPQGYSDGFDRGLSNCGSVLVAGKRCPVIGRVAMNMFAVDLSALQFVKQGEEVVLLGKQGDEQITAEEMGERIGTINYEVVSRVSPLLKRIVF